MRRAWLWLRDRLRKAWPHDAMSDQWLYAQALADGKHGWERWRTRMERRS